jgi:LPS export ABC transporter protein LptC
VRWQKTARLAIAIFVIAFAAVVFVAMRRTSATKHVQKPTIIDEKAKVQTSGNAVYEHHKDGKLAFSLRSVGQKTYPDGRSVFEHITLTLPDKDGRTITVVADEGELAAPPDTTNQLSTANLKKNVKLTTSDDLVVTTNEASYADKEGMLTVPGPVTFTRGRLSGKGVGATYDRIHDVLWILDQAQVFVAPDATGAGKLEAHAATAGLARGEHYFRLSKAAHVVTDDRTIDADDLTAQLTPDDQKITTMQLRGKSLIGGSKPGAQTMSANDIDLTFAEDGRTMQHAKLMERSVVQLPSDGGSTRRIAARIIDMGMSQDGTAVTQLTATDGVVLDLPGRGDIPTKQIRAAALTAASTSGAGLETATFEGPVDYRETRPAAGQNAAIDRKARSARLIVQTKPGLGDLQVADFLGNAKIVDGQTTAEAPRALYQVGKDRMDLSPSETGDAGLPPTVSDPQITVQARTILLTMSTHGLTADTNVRSILQRKASAGGRRADESKLPSMLKENEPVTVTANHLEYDNVASHAVYSGEARLSQAGGTEVRAQDTLELDDKTGNLTARGNVRTKMMFDDVDPKTKTKSSQETIGAADSLVYDESKRLAVYTTGPTAKAHIVGPQGDLTGERIELYLKQSGNELERAETYAGNEPVVVIESGRTAKGTHLTYTAADDTYVMTGAPVDVLEFQNTGCKRTLAAKVTFNRTDDRIGTTGGPGVRVSTQSVECPERRD